MCGALYKSGKNRLFTLPVILVSCVWLVGLSVGLVFAFFCKNVAPALLSKSCLVFTCAPLKIFLTVLPFLFSFLSFHLSRSAWMLLICGSKAICFSFCSCILCLYYGQASWLASGLFLFSDVCSLPLLVFYFLRHICILKFPDTLEYLLIICTISLLVIIDCRIVTPYAMQFVIF